MDTPLIDLWPDDIAVKVLTPRTILREQADMLSKKTKGIIRADLIQARNGRFDDIFFDLLAPAIGTRKRIMQMRADPASAYPVVFIATYLVREITTTVFSENDYVDFTWQLGDDEVAMGRLAHSPKEVEAILRVVFNSPVTKSMIFSLLAQSEEAFPQKDDAVSQSPQA